MRYNFVKFGITANLELNTERRDYLFFEQNHEKFSQIFQFLSGPKSCFVLSGFQGVGKSKILNEAISYLNSDVLLFRYKMYEATTLDDILFNLTVDFREYQKNSQTALPKIDTKDFREKIQYYVKNINKPMVLVLESYENILKFEESAAIVNDFLFHLASIDKFKIIFACRGFDSEIFTERNIDFDKTIITSLEEEHVEKYLAKYNLRTTPESIEKLISGSRCYLKYIDMTIKILQTFNISLDELIKEYELKKINYSTFLINKLISLIPNKSKELVYILTLIRQGVTAEFLNLVSKNNPAAISYLKNILILNEDKSYLYIKDYFKREIEKEIDQFSTLKIHSFLEKFYDGMLPKKPTEREIPISRTTMRREKAYHKKFIENYSPTAAQISNIPLPETDENKEPTQEIISATETTPILEKINLESEIITHRKTPQINPSYQMTDYIELAEKYEQNFDYTTAIFYYQKALEKNQDNSFALSRPNILSKVAKCYIKIHSTEKAVRCLNMAYELYFQQKQFEKANEILFELALEHKNNYNFYVAKNCLEKIISSNAENSPILLAKTYNLLADIEDLTSNVSSAKSLYAKALENALKTNEKELLSTAYFKYGLLLDDTNQQSQAIECYQKCIETSQNPEENIYLSSAYSNLAGIFYEREDTQNALLYYQKALDADKATQNNEGIYFVYSKLAQIYENTDRQACYKYLLNSLQAAKRFGDNLYIAAAYLEIGDYYYRQKEITQAIKSYLSAKHLIKDENDAENKERIERRLNDLKIIIGEQSFNQTAKGFEYNE